MPECPPGWTDGPPDFVGVGMQKAGTTWWHQLITAHPGVVDTAYKELHFFEWHWDDADDGYVPLYAKYFCRPPGMQVGEWTPRYATDPWTPAMLARAAPDTRVLVLVRDPIERFRSGISMHRSRQQRLQTQTPVDSMHPRVLVDAIERGRYARHLDRLLRWFPREQLLVLQFEQCIAATERELARTYEFLGLAPGFVPDNLQVPVFQTENKMDLTSEFLARLHDEYDVDVRRLAEGWPELDLGLWEHFADLA